MLSIVFIYFIYDSRKASSIKYQNLLYHKEDQTTKGAFDIAQLIFNISLTYAGEIECRIDIR